MDNKNVILKTHELEVIGDGPMVYTPCQIGEWWVMPVEMYTGTIPPEIQAKWDNFKALNIPVLGYLIADDLREELLQREKAAKEAREREAEAERQRKAEEWERRKEVFQKTAHDVAVTSGKAAVEVGKVVGAVAVGVVTVGGAVVVGLAVGAVAVLGALLRFDPILIAVLPDGRWICLGAWWD
jgi:hypothetical protein